MSLRQRRRTYCCVIIAIACAIGIGLSRPIRIAWHTWQMQRAQEAIWLNQLPLESGFLDANETRTMFANAEGIEDYDYHQEELVRLGALVKKQFIMQHLQRRSAESRHLVETLQFDSVPDYQYWSSGGGGSREKEVLPVDLTVWCWSAESMQVWDEWVEARDVPDYRERFMEESE